MDVRREATYKLGHYKIIDGIGGGLWWESHHGFSDCQVGRCFIEGNILIIGPSESQRPGFLKREFMEHLDLLPNWRKTKYFCSSQTIYKCKTGARMSSILEIDGPVEVILKSAKDSVADKIGDSRKHYIERLDGRKHLSTLKEKMLGAWKFFKN